MLTHPEIMAEKKSKGSVIVPSQSWNNIFGTTSGNEWFVHEASRLEYYLKVWSFLRRNHLVDKIYSRLNDYLCMAKIRLSVKHESKRKKNRAEQIINDMAKRTNLLDVNGIYPKYMLLGDRFEQVIYEYNPEDIWSVYKREGSLTAGIKKFLDGMSNVGRIKELRELPSHQLLRNTDIQDRFVDFDKAFLQANSISGFFEPLSKETANGDEYIWYNPFEIVHERYRHKQAYYDRYGYKELQSLEVGLNRFTMAYIDITLSRHLKNSNILVFQLDRNADDAGESVTEEDCANFYNKFILPSLDNYGINKVALIS